MSQFTVLTSWLLQVNNLKILFMAQVLAWLWFEYSREDPFLFPLIVLVLMRVSLLFYNDVNTFANYPLP